MRLRDAEVLSYSKANIDAPILDTAEHDIWMVEVSVGQLVVGFIRDSERQPLEVGKVRRGVTRRSCADEEHKLT